jgi:hypothetical protein
MNGRMHNVNNAKGHMKKNDTTNPTATLDVFMTNVRIGSPLFENRRVKFTSMIKIDNLLDRFAVEKRT